MTVLVINVTIAILEILLPRLCKARNPMRVAVRTSSDDALPTGLMI